MLSRAQFGCLACVRASLLVVLLGSVVRVAFSQTNSNDQSGFACGCPDGRQFAPGSSLFGNNSARVVITGFHRDLTQGVQQGLPACKELTVVGQTVRLDVLSGHPFLRRENRKTGTIPDICKTKIQFAEPKKAYDFFRDDGSALTLSDVEGARSTTETQEDDSLRTEDGSDDSVKPDLTGKDLISMLSRGRQADDPGSDGFDVNDLKEGAYIIVRRRVKATPANDPAAPNAVVAAHSPRESTIWAGSLGRIEKRAGFRDGPLWLVEVLPHSAAEPFTARVRSYAANLRKRAPPENKFVLASDDVVEINHFLDKYSLEWTRFGNDSDEAREREFAGTTMLPDVYAQGQPPLAENIEDAKEADIENDIQHAAARLIFTWRSLTVAPGNVLVLSDQTEPALSAPNFFHNQCFVGEYRFGGSAALSAFRVTDTALAIFQPRDVPQVPKGYYAVDLRMQLKSDSSGSMSVVCRFPSATIEGKLFDSAQRILSRAFLIAPAAR